MQNHIKLLSIIMILVVTDHLKAQTRIGVTGGFNLTNISEVHETSKSRHAGYFGGVALIPLQAEKNTWHLQTGVEYSLQGERNGPFNGQLLERYFLNYINVPVVAKLYLNNKGEDNRLFGELGANVGFKVSEELDLRTISEGNTETYNSFDVAGRIGIGYAFSKDWEFYVRYSYGLTDVVEGDLLNTTNRTSLLQFGINFFLFDL